VAFSEDGRYTALVSPSQIEIWDNSSRTRLVVLPDTEGNLNRAWFSPDGTLLAGASDDRIVIWNVATGEQINSIVSERDDDWLQERPVSRIREKVSEVLWESDSDALIVVNGYRELTTLRVWQLTGATPLIKYPLAGLREPRIAWTSDASKLIFRGYGGSGYPSTITFDAATWQEVPNNFQDGNWRFSPDRSLILSATFRSDIVTLLNANDLSIVREFHTHANRPNDLAWHPDGIRFASTHGDEVQVWDVSRGTLVARNTAHIANMFKENLVWSPDSRYVAFSNSVFGGRFTYNQSTLHVWDVNNAVPRLAISEHVPFVGSAAWNTTGELLLTSDTTHVTLWDGQSGHWVQELPNDYDSFVRMAAWSSDGQTIAVLQYAATQATVNLYDVTTGEIVRQISTPDATRIIWRPNSATFVTVEKESWSLWDAQTGEKVSMIPNRVFSVYWSPDGSQLATTGEHLTLWQVSSDGQALTKLGPFDIDASFDPLSWRPDGSQIAVGIGSEIQIMDVDTGMVVETMALSGEGTVSELAWSPDGMHLAWFTSDTPYLYIEDVVDD
jgi:WD40 repeat protein